LANVATNEEDERLEGGEHLVDRHPVTASHLRRKETQRHTDRCGSRRRLVK
jgi:hypothetical protein